MTAEVLVAVVGFAGSVCADRLAAAGAGNLASDSL